MEEKSEISGKRIYTGPVCKSNLPRDLEKLMEKILEHQPEGVDFDLVARAYFFAEKAHKDQERKSGESFFMHPVAVASILAELSADSQMIAASLLHDVLEDNPNISAENIGSEFGDDVKLLVEGVTKLGRMNFSSYEERKAENARKMISAITKDIRVIIIKLADRLHNLRTIKYLPEEKQKRIAQDTLDFYAPLVHRLGIFQMKNEMEDLAFKTLYPDIYNDIAGKVAMRKAEREKSVQELIASLKKLLALVDIEATIQGRAKHFYSIYQKMERDNLDFDQVMDLIALRVIVKTLKDCYTTVGVIHSAYMPLYEKFKDYIGRPKSNKYQSLHTVVMGPDGKPIEIQIRTEEMHRIAEYGVAAHWLYKEDITKPSALDQQLAFFRQVVDWQSSTMNAQEFMEILKLDLVPDEIFLFTPKGDVVALPVGSTPVDFAYHIHTEVGNQCRGAKVNGQIVPLDRRLKSGEIVEIITQKNAEPSLDWITFTMTSTAKSRIKLYYRKLKLEDTIAYGRQLLEKEERRLGLQGLDLASEQNLKKNISLFNFKDPNNFFAAVGCGDLSARSAILILKEHLVKELKQKQSQALRVSLLQKIPLEGSSSELGIIVEGVDDTFVHFAKCCLPVYGDRIVGYATKHRGISIHRKVCKMIESKVMEDTHPVNVSWIPDFEGTYLSSIDAWVLDRVGILRDMTKVIGEMKINVSDLKMQLAKDKTVRMRVRIQVRNKRELERVINSISKIEDVLEVSRSVRM